MLIATTYRVYISLIVQFARASSHVGYFNTRNLLLTQNFLKQGYDKILKKRL